MGLKDRIKGAADEPEVWIRRLTPGDVAILDLLARENGRFGQAGEHPELEPLSPSESRLFLADERTVCLVAFADQEPVAFLYACELFRRHTVLRHLCLYEMGVAEEHRGKGIGMRLLEALREHARDRGIDRGFVIANGRNRDAVELYRAFGGVQGADDDVVFGFRF